MSGNTILAAIDLQHEESDNHVAVEALKLARSHNASLHLVFIIPDQHLSYVQNYIPAEMKAQVVVDAKADLDRFAASLDLGDTAVSLDVLRGTVYEETINYADKIDADFIVIGSNRPGVKDLFIGPNAARVARHANCSVLIVRP